MDETSEPRVLASEKPPRKLNIKLSDVIIFGVIIVVVIALVAIIVDKLTLKHQVDGAKVVGNQLVADIAHRDGTAARKLGSTKFQSTYTAAQLTQKFNDLVLVTNKMPSVDQEVVAGGSGGNTVVLIYKYPAHLAKLPYYVRAVITKKTGSNEWQLTNIGGSATESNLFTVN